MNRRAGILASAVALVGSVMPAAAQLTVEGRAYGTSVSVLGTGVELLTTADTGTQSATAPGSFDEAAEGSSVDATPVADVLSSGSTTSGTADDAAEDNDSRVSSEAGDQAVVLLPGQAPGGAAVLEVVTTGATVDIHCQDLEATATSGVTELVIAGTPVRIVGDQPPNTTIVSPTLLPLIVLNEHLDDATVPGSRRVTRNAVHVRAIPDPVNVDVLDVVLSSASGAILDVPEDVDCPFVNPPSPLQSSIKLADAEPVTDADGDGRFDAGDVVRFRIRAVNSGAGDLENVRVVDRLATDVDVDPASVRIGGEPAGDAASIGACPADATFRECRDEPSTECLVVELGTLASGATVEVTFEAEVTEAALNADGEGTTCNTALIGDQERKTIVDLGDPGGDFPPLGGDVLETTGSGGCAVRPGAPPRGGELWPAGLLLALLALRRRR